MKIELLFLAMILDDDVLGRVLGNPTRDRLLPSRSASPLSVASVASVALWIVPCSPNGMLL